MTEIRQDILEGFYAGTHKTIQCTVYVDAAHTQPKSLTGAELTYAIFDDASESEIRIVKSSVVVTEIAVINESGGICEVYLLPPDSAFLHGTYRHQLAMVDGNGKESVVFSGKVNIFKHYARRPRQASAKAFLEGISAP